jgi:hypothetical protein
VILFLNHHIGISHTRNLPSMYVCEGCQGGEKIDKVSVMITEAEWKLSLIWKRIVLIVLIVQPFVIARIIEDDTQRDWQGDTRCGSSGPAKLASLMWATFGLFFFNVG